LTRSELIAEIAAANPSLRDEDVAAVVATIFNEIASALARGGRVELRGFGAFTARRRSARLGRNPRNGEAIAVDEKFTPASSACSNSAASKAARSRTRCSCSPRR
jgi:integration host factor subunit beta